MLLPASITYIRCSGKETFISSVLESPVLILAEQCRSHTRQCIALQEFQALFKCVVDVDLLRAVEDGDSTSTAALLC